MTTSKRRRAPSSPRTTAKGRYGSSLDIDLSNHGVQRIGIEETVAEAAIYPGNSSFQLDRVGETLRRARECSGEDLYAIARYLRIRPEYLAALENSRYEELPADAYVIGFLRTYASHLGLDGREIIDQYRREMAGRRRKPSLSMPQPIPEGRAPTAAIIAGAVLASLLVYAAWYGLSTANREAALAPPPLPQTVTQQPESPVSSTSSATPAQAPIADSSQSGTKEKKEQTNDSAVTSIEISGPPPAATASGQASMAVESHAAQVAPATMPNSRIVVRAEKSAWVLVADENGNTIFDQILKPGDIYAVPDKEGLFLTTGNGGGIVISLDGADLPRLAKDSRLVRNVPLDPEQLKNRPKTP